ncbi:MAG: hypothetical protein R2769_07165 [Saprospiraceae bacterium]
MDIRYFLHLIWQKKWLLISISILSAVAAFLLMSRLPETYKSNAILSTGIIEFKGAKLSQDNPFYQQFQVDNAFDNLKEGIQSRTSIQLLTQSLLYHDLNPQEGEVPFRSIAANEERPENDAIASFVNNIDPQKFPLGDSLSPSDRILLANLAKSLKYDYESIRKNLEVQRIGKTDYLKIEFTSEKPDLSYFVVKTFCKHILELDKDAQNSEENSTVNFYSSLVKEKKLELDTLTRKLNLYNANQNLVNLEEQAKSTVGQLKELELLREQYNKEIPALEANINNLNHYIKQTARINADNYASSIFLNEDVKQITEQIRRLNEAFVSGGRKDPDLENQISKLREDRQKLIDRVANNETKDADEVVKRNRELLDKRLEKELALGTAKEGVQSLDKEISRLKSETKKSCIQRCLCWKSEPIEIVRKEYFDLVNKLQDAEQVSKSLIP